MYTNYIEPKFELIKALKFPLKKFHLKKNLSYQIINYLMNNLVHIFA